MPVDGTCCEDYEGEIGRLRAALRQILCLDSDKVTAKTRIAIAQSIARDALTASERQK